MLYSINFLFDFTENMKHTVKSHTALKQEASVYKLGYKSW